jgi:ATP synthase protein I
MVLGPEARKQLTALGSVATIGIEMAVSIAVGYFGGRWLDGHLHTTFIRWVGLGLGVVAAYRSLYKLTRKTKKQLEQHTPEPPDSSNPS